MKCLLVDDEPGIREGLAMLLRRRGFEVHTAGDCAAAQHQLATQTFDVVVSDWRLPDGLALTFAFDSPAPVVAVSGHPEEVEVSGSIREVMAKPVRPAQLLERIAAVVAPIEEEEVCAPKDVQRVIDDVLAQLPEGLDAIYQPSAALAAICASSQPPPAANSNYVCAATDAPTPTPQWWPSAMRGLRANRLPSTAMAPMPHRTHSRRGSKMLKNTTLKAAGFAC
jgi:CheY-like chemotaxis protein